MEMENGDLIRFKVTGYEIAHVSNKEPAQEWTGVMMGGPNDTHVVLWCERERREAAAVYVALQNLVANVTLGVDAGGKKLPNTVLQTYRRQARKPRF